MREQRAQTFHVVTVVWGRPYVELFLGVTLPNQLTPGNLGALPAGSRYRIFTAPEDADALATSPILGRVKALMPVDLVVMPELSESTAEPLIRVTASQCRALTEAREVHAGLLFVNADHFMSEGTLAAVMRRHAAGSRAVASPGIRLDKDTFVRSLDARGGIRSLQSRDLVSLALDHLHPFTRAHMIDAPQTACSPISVYWKVAGEGILARAFFLQPLMVDPVYPDVRPKGTVDAKYLIGACPDREQIHVASDSDEICVFELSSIDAAAIDLRPGGITRWRAAQLLSGCDAHGQFYWTVPIRVHTRDINASWGPVEEQSARFARQVAHLNLVARWMLLTSRRFRPVRKPIGALRKRLRHAVRRVSPERIRRSVAPVAHRLSKVRDRAGRASRHTLRRGVRSVEILRHAAMRRVARIRKRATRTGRRVVVR